MLGKVFESIININSNDPLGKYKKIKQIIDNMIKYKPEDRITLEEVISALVDDKKNNKERKGSENECASALLAPPAMFNHSKQPRKYSMGSTNSSEDIKITIKHILEARPLNTSSKRDIPETPSLLNSNRRFSMKTPQTTTNAPQRKSLGALDCESYFKAASSAAKSCSSKSGRSSKQISSGR
jgi:hypothetical protein